MEIFDLEGDILSLKRKIEWKDFDLRIKDIDSRMLYETIGEVAMLESKNKKLEEKNNRKKSKIKCLREENEKLRKELKSSKIIIRGFNVFVSIGIIFIVAKFFLNKKANSKKNTSKRLHIHAKKITK